MKVFEKRDLLELIYYFEISTTGLKKDFGDLDYPFQIFYISCKQELEILEVRSREVEDCITF